MARPFAVFGFSMFFVCVVLFFLPEEAIFAVLTVLAVGLVVALTMRKKGDNPSVPAAFASGLLACLLLLVQLGRFYYPSLGQTGEKLKVRAQIVSNAEHKYGKYYYQLQTLTINGEQKRLRLRFTSNYPVYAEPYDEISYTGTIFALGEEDPERAAYYKSKGMYLGSFAQSFGEDRYEVTRTHSRHPMKAVLWMQRNLRQQLTDSYSATTGGLLAGMLLGDKSGLRWAAQEEFRSVGISHLFSVSGLHVSLLAWSLFKALKMMRCKNGLAVGLSAGFVLLFMAITGFSSSCVRAGVMMWVLLGGELGGRKADSLNSLGLAALVLLLPSPLAAGQVGLQLSFGATLGIILFQGRFAAPVRQWAKTLPTGFRHAIRPVNEGLAVTAAATALTLPVQLLQLPGGASLLTFLANLLFVPLSGAVMILGGVSALTVRIPFLHVPLKNLTEPLGQLLGKGVHALAGVPAPMMRGNGAAAFLIALCALICALALTLRFLQRPLRLRWVAGSLCVTLLLGFGVPGLLARGQTKVERLDTGNGYAVLVSQGGKAALLGCGGDELPAGAAKRALQALGTRQLELLLLPGDEPAFAAGAAELLRDVGVGRLMIGGEGAEQAVPWPGCTVTYYQQGGTRVCLVQSKTGAWVVRFLGKIPEQWKEATPIGGD
ncbi:MAG: ComEC/Rec2 family competence protein [Oscillospiraceae bacterium]|nr:ComEC/Rec2 family competence protein [Oscillospiraceae bacterium]